MKCDFSVLIGEFDSTIDFPSTSEQEKLNLRPLRDSYYTQFMQSEESLYFFKYEDPESDIDKIIENIIKDDRSSLKESHKKVERPVLYQLNAFQNRAERVLVRGKPIPLPLNRYTNHFSIIRPLDLAFSS